MGLEERDTTSKATPRGPYRTAASSRGRARRPRHRDVESLAILAALAAVGAIPVSALLTDGLHDHLTNIGCGIAVLSLIALVVQVIRGDRSGASGSRGAES